MVVAKDRLEVDLAQRRPTNMNSDEWRVGTGNVMESIVEGPLQ